MLRIVESFLRDMNLHLWGYCCITNRTEGPVGLLDYDPILPVFVSVTCEHVGVCVCLCAVFFSSVFSVKLAQFDV